MTSDKKKKLKRIHEAISDFPRVVREKKRRAMERKKFVEKTFGPLIEELLNLQKKKK